MRVFCWGPFRIVVLFVVVVVVAVAEQDGTRDAKQNKEKQKKYYTLICKSVRNYAHLGRTKSNRGILIFTATAKVVRAWRDGMPLRRLK